MTNPILERRSVRKFEDRPVERELIESLLEAADAAPSACNKRPLEFYAVTNEHLLEKLSKAGLFTRMKAPLVIVVVGDLNRALPSPMSDYWMHDAGAACENILLQAVMLGLGACWCGVHPQKRVMEKVCETLGLKENQIPFAMIKIGYPAEKHKPHEGYDKKRAYIIE
jgi:nitroreductase